MFKSFVDADGKNYHPVKTFNDGPYGKATIFTGPKVQMYKLHIHIGSNMHTHINTYTMICVRMHMHVHSVFTPKDFLQSP